MLSYRHGYHAGNVADVFKHTVLALLVQALLHKDTPLFYLDTHAGSGRYDLQSPQARKTSEYREGIERLWTVHDVPAAIESYLTAVRTANGVRSGARPPSLHCYPGSPLLVRTWLRPGDRMVLTELNRTDVEALEQEFVEDRRVKIHRLDAWQGLKAFLPPRERRGLVLIDAPFDRPGEFARLISGLRTAIQRWATGVYALWYPVLDCPTVTVFHSDLKATGVRRLLIAELCVHPEGFPFRMRGSGMLVVNPPWQLDRQLVQLLPWLWATLAPDRQGGHRVEWLVPE
jgi:Protein involved in catabolism of external DNA